MALFDNYLNLIPSQHRNKPKFIQTVSSLAEVLQSSFKTAQSLAQAFNLDTAAGQQLDGIGMRIGASRVVSVNSEQAYILNDSDFRIYLRAKIVKNSWDGEIESLQDDWLTILGSHLIIVDNLDMTIDVYLVGVISQVVIDLIKAHLIVPKPISVRVRVYYFAPGKLFSYGMENELCTGYGGWWRHKGDEPSFWYDTGAQENNKAGYNVGFWSDTK